MADIKGAVIVLILLAFVHGSSCCPCEDYSGYGYAVSGGHVYEPTYYYECTPLTIIEATYVPTCSCGYDPYGYNNDCSYLGDNSYYNHFHTDPYCWPSYGYNDYNGGGCYGGPSCGFQTASLAVVDTCGCNHYPFYSDPYYYPSYGYNDYLGDGCCRGLHCDCHSASFPVLETCGCRYDTYEHNCGSCYLGDNSYYDPLYTDPYCCHSYGCNDYNGNGCCGGQSCGCQTTLEVVETCGCNCNSHGHNYDFGYLGDNIYYDPFYTDPYCCHSNGYNDYNGNGCCGGQSCGCQTTLAVVETCGCNCNSHGHNYGSGYKGEEKYYNPYYSNNYDCPYNGYNDCFEIGLCWGCQASAVGRKL